MLSRKIVVAFCLICFVSSSSREQQPVPPRSKPAGGPSAAQSVAPPPKPAGDGPSLEVTMKFIQDKLNNIGPIRYRVSTQFKDGTSIDGVWTDEVTNVVADPQRCIISYHDQMSYPEQKGDGAKPHSYDLFVNFKEVERITVELLEQIQNDQPETDRATIRPPIFLVRLYTGRKSNKGGGSFCMADEELANRLARAITHAVELCTPDKKTEPF